MYITQGSIHTMLYFGLSCTFIIKALQFYQPQSFQAIMESTLSSGDHRNDADISVSLTALDISGLSDSGDACLPITPSKESKDASENRAELQQSVTPESFSCKGSETFCTPVFDRTTSSVVHMSNNRFAKVTPQTKFVIINLSDRQTAKQEGKKVTFSSIGGMEKQIKMIKEIFELPLEKPELLEKCGMIFFKILNLLYLCIILKRWCSNCVHAYLFVNDIHIVKVIILLQNFCQFNSIYSLFFPLFFCC